MRKQLTFLVIFIFGFFTNLLNSPPVNSKDFFSKTIICNKSNKEDFRKCLIEKIPLGKNFDQLKYFLFEHGFYYYENKLDLSNNRFYFYWQSNNLSDYKIVVVGHYDAELKIIELRVN